MRSIHQSTLHDVIYFQNNFKYNFCICAKFFSFLRSINLLDARDNNVRCPAGGSFLSPLRHGPRDRTRGSVIVAARASRRPVSDCNSRAKTEVVIRNRRALGAPLDEDSHAPPKRAAQCMSLLRDDSAPSFAHKRKSKCHKELQTHVYSRLSRVKHAFSR
jgi:hypothetical protein